VAVVKKIFAIALVVAAMAPAWALAEETPVDGTAIAIRAVIAGKTCVGADVIRFGASAPRSPGTFERAGHPIGAYSIGYGTILVEREHEIHGHLAAVAPATGMLYLSSGTYRCGG
jgi:hypothetical protein